MRTLALASFLLAALPLAAAEPVMTVEKSMDAVEFRFGDETVATYVIATSAAKPYFFPLNAPGGVSITRAWPMMKGVKGETTDHIHQKSAWFCHGDVIPEGFVLKTRSSDKRVEGVDFWSETPGHGKMVCVDVGEVKTVGATVVSLPTKNEWRTADGEKILDERRTITASKLDKGYLIVLDVDFHATVCAITFGDTKEGAVGVRVPDKTAINTKDGGIITSSDGKSALPVGKDNLPMWGIAADWHDYSGTVGEATAGVAIFDDVKNVERSVWHTRAYGLMAANPFGRAKSGFPGVKEKKELVTIPKGEHLKLRYGIYTHTGDAKAGEVARAFEIFSGKK